MLKEIAQLLRLQDRDQKIKMYKAELEAIPLEQSRIDQLVASKKSVFEQIRQRFRELEVQKKRLELDAQSRRDAIVKYKGQQFQTRKNEEFQAIGQEIHRFEKEIEQIEDTEIELMEEAEKIGSQVTQMERELLAAKRHAGAGRARGGACQPAADAAGPASHQGTRARAASQGPCVG